MSSTPGVSSSSNSVYKASHLTTSTKSARTSATVDLTTHGSSATAKDHPIKSIFKASAMTRIHAPLQLESTGHHIPSLEVTNGSTKWFSAKISERLKVDF